jgi:hypothetical protein
LLDLKDEEIHLTPLNPLFLPEVRLFLFLASPLWISDFYSSRLTVN